MSKLTKLVDDASRAHGYIHHVAPGADVAHAVSKQHAGSIIEMCLADPLPVVSAGMHYGASNIPAGKTLSLQSAIAAASRVAQAGTAVIPYRPAPVAIQTDSGIPVFYERPSSFRSVTAASFLEVDDEDDATVSALPVLSAPIDIGDSASHALHFSLSRKDRRDTPSELLDYEVTIAIALGLANLVDRILLAAIQAATPTAFTLAKAAAKGLKFSELRALGGTVGTGAAVGADGVLRVAGVSAELTDQAAGSYVGAFTRSGIVIHDDLRVIAHRLNVNSDLEITVYANVQPLLPDPGCFWVGA